MFFPHTWEKSKKRQNDTVRKKSISIPQPNVLNVYNKYMGGVDRIDQNISCYMVNLRSKKWWWPLFQFCIDVTDNTFQLYQLSKFDVGESRMDALKFRRTIVEAYYNLHRNKWLLTMFPGARATPREQVKQSKANHWIMKGKQPKCARKDCGGTSLF